MAHSTRLIAAIAILLTLPVTAQEDEQRAYFSVSSDRTYAPGESPTVQLWGHGFSRLQFRLYKVNDPVQFFERLEDAHNFGGQPPQRPAGALTRLERFRQWKLALRRGLRDAVRAQFSQESRDEYNAWAAPSSAPAAKPASSPAANVQSYANVPVLNQQQLVSTWEQPFANKENRWESSKVPVPVKNKGLYLLEATNGSLQAYTIISVTDIAVISKVSPGRVMARVVRRDTGAPISGVAVKVFNQEDKKKFGEGVSAANGLFEAAVKEAKPDSVTIVARQGEDFAAISAWGGNLSTDAAERINAYIYTDRPVYRPGHKVNYRVIVRDRADQGYQIPASLREAQMEVQDAEGNTVHRDRRPISANGTASGEFTLAASAALGSYSLQLRIGDHGQSANFDVEEYKKHEYEVRVTPKQRRMLQGGEVEAVIDARYFYGEPVAGAKVNYVVHRSRSWPPFHSPDDDDDGGGEPDDSPYANREQVLEQEGALDAEGKLTVRIPTDKADHDLRYRIEGRVTDAAGREISGAGFVVATVANYYISVSPDRYVYSPGDPVYLDVETRDYDGRAVPNIAVAVELNTYRWREKTHTTVARASGRTDAQGKTRLKVDAPRGGSFLARVASNSPEGRVVEADAHIWVSGSGYSGGGPEGEQITIVPDKKQYKPGETAKVMIVAAPGSHVWVTVEGKTLYRSEFVTTAQGTAMVNVPVDRAWVPNVYVSAAAIHRNRYSQATKILKVPPAEQTLRVEVSVSKPQFKPGEPAVYTIAASNHLGAPVQGEFSLGVVDEAIYAVRPEAAPDIVNHFYGRQYARVGTESSLSYFFNGQAGKRRMQLANIRLFQPRAQLKPDRLVQPKVRKAFPDTAFWSAMVRTGSDGRAQVKMDFPDALTTWRATVRGITADSKVGAAVHKVIVRKNLLIRLSTPRFFRHGDTVTVTAIAQNFLPGEKKVRLSLEGRGVTVEGGTQDITVASRGTGTFDYTVRVPGDGSEAVLLGKALTDEESDAVELAIPIQPYGLRMSDSRGGSLTSGSASAEISFPSDAEPGSRMLEISASPSVAGAMFDALEYLTSFPYGCTEQTMSSFLPNVVVSQTIRKLGLKTRVDEATLAKQLRAGLERLYSFQHEDGGWGWWQTDDSTPFMTAYVVAGLAQAKAAGQTVDEDRMGKAMTWLAGNPELAKEPADLRAFAAYALALGGDRGTERLTALLGQRASLSPYGLALLGLAMQAADDKRSGEIATALEAMAKSSQTEVWWEAAKDDLMELDVDASPEATAFAMKLLSREKPSSALLPKAALYLVNHRNQGYYWNSTKQTAMVIHGLVDFVGASGELKPNFTANVTVNGKVVLTKRFTEADGLQAAAVKLNAAQLEAGVNRIQIAQSGGASGRLYWSARGNFHSTKPGLAKRGNKTLNVRREYFRLTPAKQGDKIVHTMEPVASGSTLTQGDVIAVKLTVAAPDWRYLMIEDPIPAGAELVERDDLYEFAQKPDWWEFWFTRRELRDDRAVFFQTYSPEGESRYFYLMKIMNPGKFRVSPARVEPMYQPEYFGSSEALNLEVRR